MMLCGMDEFRFCSWSCGNGQLTDGGAEAASFFTCTVCTRRTCLHHNCKWHDGITCTEYDQQIAAKAQDGDDEVLVQGVIETKACPSCGTHIAKAGGCDVMCCCGR